MTAKHTVSSQPRDNEESCEGSGVSDCEEEERDGGEGREEEGGREEEEGRDLGDSELTGAQVSRIHLIHYYN